MMDEYYNGYKIDRDPELWKGTVINYDGVENFEQLQARCPGYKIVARYGQVTSLSHDRFDHQITSQQGYDEDTKNRSTKIGEYGPFCGYWAVREYASDVT